MSSWRKINKKRRMERKKWTIEQWYNYLKPNMSGMFDVFKKRPTILQIFAENGLLKN